MLIRYKKELNGSSVPVAEIYSAREHGIDPRNIDLDALWVIRKLKQSGAEAYIVGGAVRDLLLGRTPKDFDIATSATPRQVQKLFWNARIIGKRFKLVHLLFRDKTLEVSTFRSGDDGPGLSIYGTVDQDAKRRDFTINSLYYDPTDGQLFDFNRAMSDFKHKRIRSILPLDNSFVEDPVRMVRAIKYSVTTGLSLQADIRRAIKRHAEELAHVSSSRLTEEVVKILASGDSAPIVHELQRYKLLVHLLPRISVSGRFHEVEASLRTLDVRVRSHRDDASGAGEIPKGEMLAALAKPIIMFPVTESSPEELFKDTYGQVKTLISPMTPPNYDVEHAVVIMLSERDIPVPKSCLRAPRPDRQTGRQGQRAKGPRHGEAFRKPRKNPTVASHQGGGRKAVPSGTNSRRHKPKSRNQANAPAVPDSIRAAKAE